jgi:hypothetical protein
MDHSQLDTFIIESRIIDSGDSIFDYDYLREYESQIEKATASVLGTRAKQIYIRKTKIHLIGMSL